MPNRDIKNSLVGKVLMNETIATDTNTDSTQLDAADFDGGVKFNVFAQAYSDGTYTVEIHASDTDGFTPDSSTLLAGDELIPSGGTISITAILTLAGNLDSLGYISAKRFAKVRIVSTGTSSGALIMVIAENNPEIKPEV